jgi:acyl-CoA reductase-like NAD-dependent aldehyde dehydrogenase
MNYREKFSVPERFFMWIDGQEMPSSKDEWFPVVNPSNGELICEAARGKSTDVDHAVTRA